MGTINKTTTQLNLLADGAYGGIHQHDNAVAQSIANGTTYVKLTEWADNDPSNDVVPDEANGQITLTTAGIYKVEAQLSMASDTGNITSFASAFLDGVEQEQCHFTRKIGVASDVGSASFTGLVTATAGQVLDLRMRHNSAGSVDITIQYGSFNVTLESLG